MFPESEIAVKLSNITESYKIPFRYPDKTVERQVRALIDIDLTIYKGESVGILGPNGAGKTTLLKIIAGILQPQSGKVTINGTVKGIFELGGEFIPEMTGYENLKMALKLYGIYKKELIEKIIKFSELGDFIYAPLRIYSQGMYLRLAFSIAIHSDPDILIIDDVLAVGDYHFQKKCIDKIRERIANGKTIIMVSHNFDLVQLLCHKCILLDKGRIIEQGRPKEIKSLFMDISGNILGVAGIKNENLNLTFNNGRISLRYKGFPLTVDIGIFPSFKKNDQLLYFKELTWEAQRTSVNEILSRGFSEKEEICKFKITILKERIEFSLDSKSNAVELNFMLHNVYTQFQVKDELLNFPPFPERQTREWHKIYETFSDLIKLIPLDEVNYKEISLKSDSTGIKFELFNYRFSDIARIIKVQSFKPYLKLSLDLVSDSEKCKPLKGRDEINTLITKFNNLFHQKYKIEEPLIKKIYFLNTRKIEALENYSCKILTSDIFSGYKACLNFLEPEFSLILFSWIKDSKIILKFIPLNPKISKFLSGIGIVFNSLYKHYLTSYFENIIISRKNTNIFTDVFKSNWLKFTPIKSRYPELKVNLNKITEIEIVSKPPALDIDVKFLHKFNKEEYIIELEI